MRKRGLMLLPILAVLLYNCANMKAPGGGPKDIYAPVVLASDPPNYSTHFDAKKIELKFDEFVVVSDVTTEVFISPPLEKTPEIKTRGKSVIIEIDEKLHDSTTYSIFFGKSIKDLTENNPIENYNYVFSTGDKIDSLSVIGEVIDAFELKPRGDVLVMLYEDSHDTIPFDSLPFLVKPAYLTRSNEAGFFVINNLREDDYMLFALADNNFSSTYDNAEEEVAFLDSLITPLHLAPELTDTLAADSLAQLIPADSNVQEDAEVQAELLYDIGEELAGEEAADSLGIPTDSIPSGILDEEEQEGFYTLFMFKEEDTVQRLLGAEKPRKRVLLFVFRQPAGDVEFTPLTPVPYDWKTEEWNEGMDTLRYYITNGEMDTISLRISLDTTVFDTVSFELNREELPQRKKDEEEEQILRLNSNARSGFPYYRKLELLASYPITEVDLSRFLLVENSDSLAPELEVFGTARRKLRLTRELQESSNYLLFFPDSVITDVLGRSNDTTQIRFSTNAYENYGLYQLHVSNGSQYEQLIIQLLTEEGKVVREELVLGERMIKWDFVVPGKYMIKAIADIHRNGKWDTGNYLKKQQPEPIVFYPDIIEIREGWSFEEDWFVEFR